MGAPRLRPHNPQELKRLLDWCSGAGSILEIGSRYGYTLCDIAHVMQKGARVISIDLPDQEGWNDPEAVNHLRANMLQLVEEGYDAHLKLGDSHDPETLKWAKQFTPFDIVFIDGDHTYEGVLKDWRDYGPLGNTVIFHDIRKPKPPEWMGLGVWRLWRDIKTFSQIKKELPIEEYRARGSKMGIGKIGRSVGTSVSA